MATPVVMPKAGNTVESCIIVEWKKQVGDAVALDDVLCDITASMSVEHEGATGIPSRAAIIRYMDGHPFTPNTSEQSKF